MTFLEIFFHLEVELSQENFTMKAIRFSTYTNFFRKIKVKQTPKDHG